MKTCKCGETFDDSKAVHFSSREGRERGVTFINYFLYGGRLYVA